MTHIAPIGGFPSIVRITVGLLWAVGFLAQPPATVQGAITWTGNVEPDPPTRWNSTTYAFVGKTADGSISVDDDSDLSSRCGYLGYGSGVVGTANVTGAGSQWINSDTLLVGLSGSAALRVEAGAEVSNTEGYLGYGAGSTGTATITGPGSKWANSRSLTVGESGSGTLLVEAGGEVSSSFGYIANVFGSTGAATVSGSGSKWTNSYDFDVGRFGSGTLLVEAGGKVSSERSYVGFASGSTGTVTVTGPASAWSNWGNLYIGEKGSGTLTVADGGEVTAGTLFARLQDLHGNGTITAHGAVLDADFRFDAAHAGQAIVQFGSGGTLTVRGTGGGLGAGYNGIGTFTVSEGVTVSGCGYLGYHSGSSGTATITGTGSKWNSSSGWLFVGRNGSGTLRVEAGAEVTTKYGYVGHHSGSTGTATVTGPGSKWANSYSLSVGTHGSGSGTLLVEHGAEVTSSWGYVAQYPGSTGAATVTGAGSRWTNAHALYVGANGHGTLTVADGGEVDTQTLCVSLDDLHGNGTITARGAVLDADLRFDGVHGAQAIMEFGSGGTLTVIAAGGDLGAGYNGNGTLTVAQGVVVNSGDGFLGRHSGSTGTATITGAGSKWTISDDLHVGANGTGMLRVEDGAQVSTMHGHVGHYSGSTGTATITGRGSRWTNSISLHVGGNGSGTLHILDGGAVTASAVSINSSSLLAIDVGTGSELRINDGRGTMNNAGTVRILAGAAASAGEQHSPVVGGRWEGRGTYQPIGGTWDGATHVFTVSAQVRGMSGAPVALDLSQSQRVLIHDSSSGRSLGASFPAANATSPISLTAEPITGDMLYDLQYQLASGLQVFGAWELSVQGFVPSADEPVYLSFDVGREDLKTGDLAVWHYDGSQWGGFPANVALCRGYASFEIQTPGTYAVSAVPEAGALALLLGAAFAGVLWQWWRARRA